MKKRLALITWSGLPQGAESERLVLPHLADLNKFYLREMPEMGIEITPTVFVNGSGPIGSSAWQEIGNWKKSVVKPAVSASAHKTRRFDGAALPEEDELKSRMEGEPFLIQQFIPEIEAHGEISFVYIDGAYSHAALKRTAAGDFRVQQEHGGSAEPISS